MRRREFITLLGGAAVAWPSVARTQQPRTPVVGFLSVASAAGTSWAAFRQRLKETGFIEGQNVHIALPEWATRERMPDPATIAPAS